MRCVQVEYQEEREAGECCGELHVQHSNVSAVRKAFVNCGYGGSLGRCSGWRAGPLTKPRTGCISHMWLWQQAVVPGCRAGVCPEGRQATAETRRVDTASAYRVLCSCSLRKRQQSKAMQHKAEHTEACCTLAMVQQVTATAFDGAAQALQTDRCQHACAYLFNMHLVSSICGKGIQLLLLLCNLLCLGLLARLLCTAAGAEQVCRPCEALNPGTRVSQ